MANRDTSSVVPADRLRRIETLTDSALAHLSVEDLLVELLDRVRELLEVDTAAVLLPDKSQQYLVATAARGLEEEIKQGVRVPLGKGFAGRIAASKEPVAIEEITHQNVVNPILREKGVHSVLGVPLIAEGAVIGVMHVGTQTERRFTDQEIQVLQLAGDRVALATQARLWDEERTAASTLQRSLLPPVLPQVPGLEFATRYVPGSGGRVGGDWYDVFSLPSGRLCVVVGDVAGRGLSAAVAMGRLRSTVRAHALDADDPAEVLRKLDRHMHHFELGVMATTLCAMIEPSLDKLLMSSAGHPPPVVARPEQDGELVPITADLPLGVDPAWPRQNTTVPLLPGHGLLFYTDGLIERRGVSLDHGLAKLCRAVHPAPAESVCVSVMSKLVGSEQVSDDIALLMLSRLDSEATARLNPPA